MLDVAISESAFLREGEGKGLETYGISTCVGIAIANHTQKWVGLLHADNVCHGSGQSDFEGFVLEAVSLCKPADWLAVLCVGADTSDPESAPQTRMSRTEVERVLGENLAGAEYRWIDKPRQSFDLKCRLDPIEISSVLTWR